ncbi:hypothetical protein [Vibrio ouci]|uniref:Uncharacterized protein n=1 Tax=Vibrio ouci TaxID=2499078 RepID=A0A4Y8WBH1_9VIBR|nr:hypothetical protein [Vibrio ouci]TFH90299.1 hypothetical protein ELS82_17835 [Vibrio ouci]
MRGTNFIKQHLLITLITGFSSLMFAVWIWHWQSFVQQYVYPHVVSQLLQEQYLRDQIQSGKFVSTEIPEFSTSFTLPGKELIALSEGAFVSHEQLIEALSSRDRHRDELEAKVEALTRQGVEVDWALAALNTQYQDSKRLLSVVALGELKVRLFVSERKEDRGRIILNVNDAVIAKLMENGGEYTLRSNGTCIRVSARIESVFDEHHPIDAAIGRLHLDDYHQLFAGARDGSREAVVVLKEDAERCVIK